MRLPVDQYASIPLPLSAQLTRLPTTKSDFQLRVPPLTFAVPGEPITVQPTVRAQVEAMPECVRISSDECVLEGSTNIARLRLNELFTFSVRVLLTWEDGVARRSIRADSRIEVDVQVPTIFAFVPRRLLETIAGGATSVVLDALLRAFLSNLGEDYARWATDEAYREARRRQFEHVA